MGIKAPYPPRGSNDCRHVGCKITETPKSKSPKPSRSFTLGIYSGLGFRVQGLGGSDFRAQEILRAWVSRI